MISSSIEKILISNLHKLEADGRPIPHNRWQKILASALRKVVPAPHRAPLMEWHYGTWTGSFAGYDETGRQLGEANVLPEWLASPLDDQWSPFRGPGSREGCPFNVDAFKEMGKCWNGLLQDAVALRRLYCDRYLGEQTKLNAMDLFIISSVGVSSPSYLLRRNNSPIADGKLPRQSGAVFKVIGGMYAATSRMVSQAHPMLLEQTLDPDRFLAYLEAEHLLLSPEMRACAAPERMIRQMLSALTDPNFKIEGDDGLAYLEGTVSTAFDYGVICARIDLAVLLHWRQLREFLLPILQDKHAPELLIKKLTGELELGITDGVSISSFKTMVLALEKRLDDKNHLSNLSFLKQLESTNFNGTDFSYHSIGKKCFSLEKIMREFATQQQAHLDKVLQSEPKSLPTSKWSPAPASEFTKALFKIEPRLTKKISSGNAT